MLSRSCLLIKIGRSRKGWNPTIFESEEGFRLRGAYKVYVW